jgi:cAMP-dependent protein kinase regulator
VFGQYNKKEDFVPKVIAKTPETKAKLTTRLLQAFMFNALEQKELNIVIDAIEEVKIAAGENVIV